MKLALLLLTTLVASALGREPVREVWGKTPEGEPVEIYTLTNAQGLRARVITWGATLVEMSTPDRAGKLADVTLGYETLAPYLRPNPFFGSTVGRYANRIADGRFILDGRTYELATNNGPNHLHGGVRGFDKRNWTAAPVADGVRFTYTSVAGEEGYPGKMVASVTYTLNDANELRFAYEATTDAPTVVNLTNHTYWNLAAAGDVRGHELQLNAERYCEADTTNIPTGKLLPVKDGPMDFTSFKPIGRDLGKAPADPGYDHNFVIRGNPGELRLCATLVDPASGRRMEVETTEPGVQLYTSNHMSNVAGKGRTYGRFAGVCLETQHYPDSPNQPAFPSTVLRPGETFRSTTLHRFSAK